MLITGILLLITGIMMLITGIMMLITGIMMLITGIMSGGDTGYASDKKEFCLENEKIHAHTSRYVNIYSFTNYAFCLWHYGVGE